MTARFFAASAMLGLGIIHAHGVIFTNLHSFSVSPHGARPEAGLVRGPDGNFYGTTDSGGTNGGFGTVFRLDTNGVLTTLYSFSDGNDGANPDASLALGPDHRLYGTASSGGTNQLGTVFAIDTNGVFTPLYSFTGGNDGSAPVARLFQGTDGGLYGTTSSDTNNGNGAVFRIDTNGNVTPIYQFTGLNDGGNPLAGVTQGVDGNLYGTAAYGGSNFDGTIYQLTTNGGFTLLYTFGTLMDAGLNPLDGQTPGGDLIPGPNGSFYGTAEFGGANLSYGTVFQIMTNQTLNVVYSFGTLQDAGGDALDGSVPSAALVPGGDGNFYGTTDRGGTNDAATGGDGTVFKITPGGTLTTLYSFANGHDGAAPVSTLVVSNGFFYGTTSAGGTNGNGTVFKITNSGAPTTLYDFPGISDGGNPSAALVRGADGNFYGTTENGGTNGNGLIFKVSTNGTTTVVAEFGASDGNFPEGALLQHTNGVFYGTTSGGGAYGAGTVFTVTTNGTLNTIYQFGSYIVNNSSVDGDTPLAGLAKGPDGNFYGTTSGGGINGGFGTVFVITPAGVLTPLVAFGNSDGANPMGILTLGADGAFYGTTSSGGFYTNGTVFRMTLSPVLLTTTYSFSRGADGQNPEGGLVQTTNGNFFGTTASGGTFGNGTIFQTGTNGPATNLVSFDGTNGSAPMGELVRGGDGNYYGTTSGGGAFGGGVIYQLTPGGVFTVVYSLSPVTDGSGPDCGMALGTDGSLYGVAENDGAGGMGSVFRLSLSSGPPPIFQRPGAAGGNLTLTWSAVAQRQYQLQYKTNVTQTNWNNLGGAITANGTNLSTNDNISTNRERVYRVILLP